MIVHEFKMRVRYADTDQMGYVYYGHYARFFEAGRAELIRSLGFTYREMEERGVMMPVAGLEVRYLRPARYDDLLTIRSGIRELPEKRLKVYSEVFNEAGKLCTGGKVTLAFMDGKTNQSMDCPEFFLQVLRANWSV
ncbi:MAG: acyl-CoA thioesterase [Bacteroidia bacterium]|nr:acyl-CoA thioesterase [Bacteroidia bacterium]